MDTSNAVQAKNTKRSLGLIFAIMLMDIIGLSILAPIAPYIVQEYNSSALTVTLLFAIYAAAQFVAAPALGKISDRIGRRSVLLACVLGSAIGYFIFGIGGALWVLFLSRLIDGVSGGNLSTAMAYIADVSKPEERAKNFSLIGMAYGFGFILGPALGGALGQISLNTPVYAAGIVSLISVALIYFMLPESLPKEHRTVEPMKLNDFNPFASVSNMLLRPGLGLVLLVSMLFNLAFDGVNSTMSVFVVHKFTAQPWVIGALFVTVGIAMAIVQGALVGKASARYGEKPMAMFSLIGNAVGGLLIFIAPAFWMLFPIAFLQAGITGFVFASLGALATSYVSEREQGQMAGVNGALGGLMAMLGPLWGGIAFDAVGPGAQYPIAAVILGIACLLLIRVRKSGQAVSVAGVPVANEANA
jgi:DHA1 family tetracycline resistance protein-like MFS transporter